MVTVRDITEHLEAFAPLDMQASYDNAGLIIGRADQPVSAALIAVDLTEAVIAEAVERGCDMVITHHPIIFSPLKRFNSASCVERCVEMAIRSGIAIYASHTNLDSAPWGMSWRLGDMLGLRDMEVLDVTDGARGAGFGVVGELSEAVDCELYIDRVAEVLSLEALRHSDIVSRSVKRVAICTGSGGSLIGAAISSKADLYVTADLRYNDFFTPQREVTVLDVGHYESEYCAIDIIFDILSKKMLNFALHKSLQGANPVHYRCYRGSVVR